MTWLCCVDSGIWLLFVFSIEPHNSQSLQFSIRVCVRQEDQYTIWITDTATLLLSTQFWVVMLFYVLSSLLCCSLRNTIWIYTVVDFIIIDTVYKYHFNIHLQTCIMNSGEWELCGSIENANISHISESTQSIITSTAELRNLLYFSTLIAGT